MNVERRPGGRIPRFAPQTWHDLVRRTREQQELHPDVVSDEEWAERHMTPDTTMSKDAPRPMEIFHHPAATPGSGAATTHPHLLYPEEYQDGSVHIYRASKEGGSE